MNATCATHGTHGASGAAHSAGGFPRMASRLVRVISNERDAGGCHRILAESQGPWPESGPAS